MNILLNQYVVLILRIFHVGGGVLWVGGVSLYHFWETSLSTGIFGGLCAWFVPSQISRR